MNQELREKDPRRNRNFELVLDDGEEAFEAITRFTQEQRRSIADGDWRLPQRAARIRRLRSGRLTN
jgi:hypothetical protein